MLRLKLLEKQEQANPKISRRREIIKIRSVINEIETNNNNKIQSMKQKVGSLKKFNKIDRPLANLTKNEDRKKPKSVKSEMQKMR
jgi:hypothetical protein